MEMKELRTVLGVTRWDRLQHVIEKIKKGQLGWFG